MIKLPDGELRDYLPPSMKNDADMACLSYALKKATERVLTYQKQAMVYNFIDILPEQICDVLAVELRSPYYSDLMTIEIKRGIIKNTLRWYAKAGTAGAVAEMVKVVFGEGTVVEWPEFDSPPYTPGTFDIVTSAQLTPEAASYLYGIIGHVKNTRSHLRRLLLERRTDQRIFAGIRQFPGYRPAAITGGYNEQRETGHKLYTGIKQFLNYKPAAITDGYSIASIAGQELFVGAAERSGYKPSAVIA